MAIKNHLCQSGFGDDLMEGNYFNGCDILSIPRGNLAIITRIDAISCVSKQNNCLFKSVQRNIVSKDMFLGFMSVLVWFPYKLCTPDRVNR